MVLILLKIARNNVQVKRFILLPNTANTLCWNYLIDTTISKNKMANRNLMKLCSLSITANYLIFASLWLVSLGGSSSVFAAVGDRDVSFTVPTTHAGYILDGSVMAVQPEGGLLVVGRKPDRIEHAVFRIFNGILDETFSSPPINDTVHAIGVQLDGKILIGGSFNLVGTSYRPHLARLNQNGKLDTSFTSQVQGQVYALLLDGQGRIIIRGGNFFIPPTTILPPIVRLFADGSHDPSLDIQLTHIEGYPSEVQAMAIQGQSLIIGGQFVTVNGQNRVGMARISLVDSTVDGFVPPTLIDNSFYHNVITVQPDGKILTSGSFTFGASATYRMQADGSLDQLVLPDTYVTSTAFQTNGYGFFGLGEGVSIDYEPGANRLIHTNGNGTVTPMPAYPFMVAGLALQADGKLVLGGDHSTTIPPHVVTQDFSRLLNGSTTSTLQMTSASRISWQRGGTTPDAYAVLFESSADGISWRLLGQGTRVSAGEWELTGVSLTGYNHLRASARVASGHLNACSGLVQNYATTGIYTRALEVDSQFYTGGRPNLGSSPSAIQADGRILFFGGNTLQRVEADGQPAPFPVPCTVGPVSTTIKSVAVLDNGQIMISGDFTQVSGTNRKGLARLNSDGTLDPTFDAGLDNVVGYSTDVFITGVTRDGDVIVQGNFTYVNGVSHLNLARLAPTGIARAWLPPETGLTYCLRAYGMRPDGAVYIYGYFEQVIEGGGEEGADLIINTEGLCYVDKFGQITKYDGALMSMLGVGPRDPDVSYFFPYDISTVVPRFDGSIIVTGQKYEDGSDLDGTFFSASIDPLGVITPYTFGATVVEGFGSVPYTDPFFTGHMINLKDGRILAWNTLETPTESVMYHSGLSRYLKNGALDSSLYAIKPDDNTPPNISTPRSMVVRPDGKILVNDVLLNGTPGSAVLTVMSSGSNNGSLLWEVPGDSQEPEYVFFEYSPDGTTWTYKGEGRRANGGWVAHGLNLPAEGWVRAVARVQSYRGVSSSLIGTTLRYPSARIELTGNGEAIINNWWVDATLSNHTDFGEARVANGGMVQRVFTIHNTDPLTPLTVSSITVDGQLPTEFVVSGFNYSLPIQPGTQRTFTITFTPTNYLYVNAGRVIIASNDFNNNPFMFLIKGVKAPPNPEIEVSGGTPPTAILDGSINASPADGTDFGVLNYDPAPPNINHLTKTYTIKNDGDANLIITNHTVTGPDAARFTLTGLPTSSQPAVIVPPLGTYNFTVKFTAISQGLRQCLLNIISNDEDENTYDFRLYAAGASPEINVRGNNLTIPSGDSTPRPQDFTDFADVNIDEEFTRQFTIRRAGLFQSVDVKEITVTQPGAETEFAVTDLSEPLTATVTDDEVITFNVKFTPKASGLRTSIVTLKTNSLIASSATFTFAIQGTGRIKKIAILGNANVIVDGDTTPSNLDDTDFGTAVFSEETAVRTFTLSNAGDVPLDITHISLTGDTTRFSVTSTPLGSNPSLTLSPGQSAPVTVTFTPGSGSTQTTYTAGLLVKSTDPNPNRKDYTFALQGTGVSPGKVAPGALIDPIGIVHASAILPDHKIIVASTSTTYKKVIRLLAGGSNYDNTFNPQMDSGTPYCVAVQSDGKILVGGNFTLTWGSDNYRSIVRFNADGYVDTSFKDGIFASVVNVRSIAILEDGKILIGGSFTATDASVPNSTRRRYIARLEPDGTADGTFPNATAGAVTAAVNSIAVLPDGKILIGGDFSTQKYVARLNADGTLDTAFNPPTPGGHVNCVLAQPDGKVIIGGEFTTYTVNKRLARLKLNGANWVVDDKFDGTIPTGAVNTLALQANGDILAGGTFTITGATQRNYLARFIRNEANGGANDGALDTTFEPTIGTGAVNAITLNQDGKILLGGTFATVGGQPRPKLAWLNNRQATQTLRINPSTNDIEWLRGGSAPELSLVTFEYRPSNSSTWTMLGTAGNRSIYFTATYSGQVVQGWKLASSSLSGTGWLRARGRVSGGSYNGSSTLVEAIISYDATTSGWPHTVRELKVFGNDLAIDDGDMVPSSNDNTDFQNYKYPNSYGVGRQLTLSNTGSESLTVTDIGFGGDHAADFLLTHPDVPARPFAIPAGKSVTFTLIARPTYYFERSAIVSIASNRSGSSTPYQFKVAVTGYGGRPEIYGGTSGDILIPHDSTTTDPLAGTDLGSVGVNGTAASRTFIIKNTGNAPFAFYNLGTVLSNPNFSFYCPNLNDDIPVGGTRSFTVGFVPSDFGVRTGTLRLVSYYNPLLEYIIPLKGLGVQSLEVTGNDLHIPFGDTNPNAQQDGRNFGNVRIGAPVSRTFVMKNNGQHPISVTALGFYSNFTSQFNITPQSLPTTIPGYGTVSFTVNFDPTSTRLKQATVQIASNASGWSATGFTNLANYRFNVEGLAVTQGSADPTFTPLVHNGTIYTSAVLPNGKILIGGSFTAVTTDTTSTWDSYIVQLSADGASVDESFLIGTNGAVHSIVVEANGSILLGGAFTEVYAPDTPGGIINPHVRTRLARINADGVLSSDLNYTIPDGVVNCIAPHTNGRIVIGGSFTSVNSLPFPRLVLLDPNWAVTKVDGGFSPKPDAEVKSVVVEPNGNILIGGAFTSLSPKHYGPYTYHRVARVIVGPGETHGFIDGSFTPHPNGDVDSVALQKDGKVLIGGAFTQVRAADGVTMINRRRIARVSSTYGHPDSFDPRVTLGAESTDTTSRVHSIVVQADGKIVFGGLFSSVNPGALTPAISIARFNDNGTLDTTFITQVNGTVLGITPAPGGELFLASQYYIIDGWTNGTSSYKYGLVRLLNDPATSDLSITAPGTVRWMRGGTAAESVDVTLELFDGTNWTALGAGTRITGGWEWTNVSLPSSGTLCGVARVHGGRGNGSYVLEKQLTFPTP